jgi:hypothetical protein
VGLEVRMGWDPLALGANGIVDPLLLFGFYWLVRTSLLARRAPVLVTDGRVTAIRPLTRNALASVAIGDFEVSPGANQLLELVLPGLPYRLYWTAYPGRPRRKSAPLQIFAPAPYRSGPEREGTPAQRPKLLSFVALDLSERPLGQ